MVSKDQQALRIWWSKREDDLMVRYSHHKGDGGWLLDFFFGMPGESTQKKLDEFKEECQKRGYDYKTLTINLKGPKT